MGFRLLVNGVDRALQVTNVQYRGEHNERSELSFDTEHTPSTFTPVLRQEVVYYEQDETTPVFGGVLFTRSLKGLSDNSEAAYFTCACVDWNYYLDRVLIDGGVFTGTISLLAFVTHIVTTFLASYGFTVDPAQEVGPVHQVSGFRWERKTANAIFQDITTWTGGWIRTVSPTKVIRFIQPNQATPTAPFALTTASGRAHLVEWTESSERFATRVEVIWGGTGTREKTETFTVDSTIIAQGYYETELPTVPTTGVSATINAAPATIGAAGSGSQLVWTAGTHRVTAGTYTPVLAHVLSITYTAQYPGTTVVNGVGSPVIAMPPVEKADIIDAPTALAFANGLLLQHNQDVREYTLAVTDEGLKPGQVVQIDHPERFATLQTALITGVTEVPMPGLWQYEARAISGVYQGSPLDFWRGMGGYAAGGTVVTINTTPGTNPGVVVVPPIYLGGSRETSLALNPAAWTPVIGYVPFVATWGFTGRVRVEIWARNAGISVTARLWDLTVGSAVGTSTPALAQAPQVREFDVPITAGNTYRLEIISSANAQGVYGIGILAWVSGT